MMRLNYRIKGMSCSACVSHVEKAIRRVVCENDTVTVSLLTNSVSVVTADDKINEELLKEQISKAVRAAGYELVYEREKEESKNREIRKKLVDLILSVAFTLAVMYISMGGMIGLPIPSFLTGAENAVFMALTQLLITLPVMVINFRFFKNGFKALFHLSPNMDSLIAVGSGAAVVYGLFAIVMMIFDPTSVHSWMHDLYFESAAMILTLVSLGKLLESRAKEKASDAVRSLAKLSPKYVSVLREGKEISIPAEELRVGDLMLIRAGEWIPADGIVVEGDGSTDESALTGESMPVEKEKGSSVRAACVLLSGFLKVRAEKVGEDTSLSRIIRLLEDAAASKAPIARIADKVSSVFVPCVMGISLVTLIVWMIFSGSFAQSLRSAIAVLVISCPCALGLATPTAITVGIGRGASLGILFRSAEALEKLCSIKTVIFDKTGTLTEGKPAMTDVYTYGEESAARVMRLTASVESLSSHPLSLAVVNGAAEMEIGDLPNVTSFRSLVGVGAEGMVDGVLCRIGKPNPSFFGTFESEKTEKGAPVCENNGFTVAEHRDLSVIRFDFECLESQGKTAVLVTFDSLPVGIIGISDRIRADSHIAVEALKSVGVTCLMLTGDNERTAASVAKQAALDGYFAGLFPEDKERKVRELSEDAPCAMVGDGINDAPALVRADVGIAVGAGTEIAVDCAGIVLSGSSLKGVADAYFLSRATIRIIKQNLFWALFYNVICIPVAAGVFFPIWGIQLSPMLASAAMSFSSVFVVTNALRLRSIRLRKGEKEEMFGKQETVTYTIGVEGMMCQHCVAHVKAALEAVKGVREVSVDLNAGNATVSVESSVSQKTLADAIVKAGYKVK
ncbi:MAG: heavy metal translocating P-type ATPase [Clostridia bacterium]|nr:heavy metal translocating P-type ATPase [Clostridia bacterium]